MAAVRRVRAKPVNPTVFVAIGAAVMVLFIGIAVAIPVVNGQRTADWVSTQATVTGVEERQETRRRDGRTRTTTVYEAVVSYTVDGREYSATVGTRSSFRPEVGSTVTVIYDPDHPSRAQQQGEMSLLALLMGLIGGGIGAIFLVIGLVMRRSAARRR